ncbi:MAG: YbaB/EbfC family nucleoid-associated protein [Zymomonas mobilis]|uniref:Nucleoid-associated protein FBY58_0854 n=1 Tax=Zymomonas mobilis TaxID=542 RepID=A0A542W158_ZYMMB|nr:YbaB/EbfC family nucleoid-associated protein [Zymomonas mobilis]TQL17283.1 hypothetical protein FBY58_0854 [Zymomonas mobilis]
MDLEQMMKAAQEAAQQIQTQMGEAQAKLDTIDVEGASGGGLVKIKATAKGRITGVEIDDSLLVPAEKQMLEDLIVAACNDVKAKAEEVSNGEMAKMTQGMPLPPGMNLPL